MSKDQIKEMLRLRQTEIQPQKKKELTRSQKCLNTIDIFSFVPTPQTYTVSTKKSRAGSVILLMLFIAYVIYDFVLFVINNPPKLNSYEEDLDPDKSFQPPEMAIGFIYGNGLNQTLNDPNYFTIKLLQVQVPLGKSSITQQLITKKCGPLDWMSEIQSSYQNLTCLDTDHSKINFTGLLYLSDNAYFPRFSITACDDSKANNTCKTREQIKNMTSGGRIFLFIKRPENKNLAKSSTGKKSTYGSFYSYNYFLVPPYYNRILLSFQATQTIVYPDYLTLYKSQVKNDLVIVKQEFQMSDVSMNNQYNLFSISILLAPQQRINQFFYSTLIDHLSKWGAFWGVLFAVFALLFLAYNKKKFFDENPAWLAFEQKIEQLEQKSQKLPSLLNSES